MVFPTNHEDIGKGRSVTAGNSVVEGGTKRPKTVTVMIQMSNSVIVTMTYRVKMMNYMKGM